MSVAGKESRSVVRIGAPVGARPEGVRVALGLPRVRSARPDVPGLIDAYGRVATDLRVSLTERCNLRCRYCMSEQGLPLPDPSAVMTSAEVVHLVGIAVADLGVRQVRLTGGEPLLRPDLVELVAGIAALRPRPEISLTTNAVGLASRARALADAGLDRVNVSLDTLRPDRFTRLTRRPFLRQALAGIAALGPAGLRGTKVNAVLMRGINDDEAPDLLDWALDSELQLRFIEQMPLDADRTWDRHDMVTAAEIRASLGERFMLMPDDEPRAGAPAQLWRVRRRDARGRPSGEAGKVGIIASVTEPFCGDCRRTRLTSEGTIRSCLFAHAETDLLGPLRAGASRAEVADLWRGAMWAKQAGHGLDAQGFRPPARSMSAIGG